jgi:acyl-coenzyme A synthetase/AMP-(fatty) acid ligase
MNIITRDWIRDDALFYADNPCKEYTKKDLCEFTNYWKQKFVEYGAKHGDKVGLGITPVDIHYQAIMLAVYELGLRLVILHRPNTVKECETPKSNAHLPLDFYLYFSTFEENPVFGMAAKHYIANTKNPIAFHVSDWQKEKYNYKLKDDVVGIIAKPKDDLLLCNSSGTTSEPKLIFHTHEYLNQLCEWNWKELEFNEDDVVLHLSTINHGASLSVFAFPALKVAKKQFFNISPFDENFTVVLAENPVEPYYYDRLVQHCQTYGVTKILCANGAFIDNLIDAINRSEYGLPNTTIMVLCFINPRWSEAIERGHLKSITSPYGCSEAGGPIFMIKLDKDNVNNFDSRFLGMPTKGFYDTKVIDGKLNVDLPIVNKIIDTEDHLEEVWGGFYFVGKNKMKRINDIDINPVDIIELVEIYSSRFNFEVYVDEIYNELFIITNDPIMLHHKKQIFEDVSKFYKNHVYLTELLYEPDLTKATVSNKADKFKLSAYIDRYRNEKL